MNAITHVSLAIAIGAAVFNVALTIVHWRILSRAWRYQRECAAHHAEAESLLERARVLAAEVPVTSNGHPPVVTVELKEI